MLHMFFLDRTKSVEPSFHAILVSIEHVASLQLAGSRWELLGVASSGFKSLQDSRLGYLGFTACCFGVLSQARF
jgi:hypothetical protein